MYLQYQTAGNDEEFCMSVSRFNQYTQCPFKYGFNKILKLREPVKPYFIFGSVGHKACELVAKKVLTTPEEVRQYMLKVFSLKMPKGKKLPRFESKWITNPGVQVAMANAIYECVTKYNIVDTEVHLTYNVSGAYAYKLQGYLDAVTSDAIIDWKFTTKATFSEEYLVQLRVYAAMRAHLKNPVHVIGVMFPKDYGNPNNIKAVIAYDGVVTPEQQKSALTMVGMAVDGIKKGVFFPNRGMGNVLCPKCSYHNVCTKVLKGEL